MKNSWSGPQSRERERGYLAEAGSILLFGVALFLLASLVSYSPKDPSIFTKTQSQPVNWCGLVGSNISSLLLEFFGLGSFLFPAALFFMAATLLRRENSIRMLGTIGGMFLAVGSLTVFLTLQWKYWPYAGNLILTGGAFGVWVADFLVKNFNSFGSSIISLLVFSIAIALSTPLSIAQGGAKLLRWSSYWALKLSRLAATYFLYLLSLIAMRSAHAVGDSIQKIIEGAVKRTKERAQMAGRILSASALSPQTVPTIGLTDTALTVQAEVINEPYDDSRDNDNELQALGSINIPEILPLEVNQAISSLAEKNKAKDTVSKVVSKLAKAAFGKKENWKIPTLEFLKNPPKIESGVDRERLLENAKILTQKFADFGIQGEVSAVRPGPVITLYEFKPGPGIKVSRIASLADDLSMALSAQSVRILAPLPGKSVVGIEIPSDQRQTVYLREFMQHPDFYGTKHMIPVAMGKDISGQTYLADLARMPHLLCAGQTGAGKSVFMNGLICSLLYRFTPDELRLILVDPKFIEFRAYQDIPHLLLPVVDDPKQASIALKWAVREMERRYRILAFVGARNLAGFNQKVEEMGAEVIRDLLCAEENQLEGGSQVSGSDWIEAFEADDDGAPRIGKLPNIVVIIDELADLMMVAKKEVEVSIARVAQKARAAGIHLIIATQRPSTDVVTGLIKANLPSRVSFQLASYVDSKTILDRGGAERLLGQGDMLFVPPGISQLIRLHGAYVDDEEIHKITTYLKSQGKPIYRNEILTDDEEMNDQDSENSNHDVMFDDAVELVKRTGSASASFLQRHLRIGYNRAARMIETMESRGIVGPGEGSKPREVLIR